MSKTNGDTDTCYNFIDSLYKWGGTYLDLDVIVKHNLNTISPNYAGAESVRFVAAGVLNLDSTGPGHQIAEQCLEYVNTLIANNFHDSSIQTYMLNIIIFV